MWARNINCLSVEVLGQVFSQLDHNDLVAASSVCRLWFDVINCYLLQRKRSAILRPEACDFVPDWQLNTLSLIGFSSGQLEKVNICSKVKGLHIGYEELANSVLDDHILAKLLNSCQCLQHLSFKNVIPSESVMEVIINHEFNSLQSLSFEFSSSLGLDKEYIRDMLDKSYFPETKFVVRSLGNDCSVNLMANYPFSFDRTVLNLNIPDSITRLNLICNGLTEDAYKCLRFCKRLQSVRLINASSIEDEAILSLTELPRLNKICVTDAKNVTSKGWSAIFHCSHIVGIKLLGCATGLSDHVFKDMTGGTRHLDLDLHNCKRVTGEGLASILSISKRISLGLDYSEELLNRLAATVTLGFAPQLCHLNIIVQRVYATSNSAFFHSDGIKRALSMYSHQNQICFSYKELFTKVNRIHRTSFSV